MKLKKTSTLLALYAILAGTFTLPVTAHDGKHKKGVNVSKAKKPCHRSKPDSWYYEQHRQYRGHHHKLRGVRPVDVESGYTIVL